MLDLAMEKPCLDLTPGRRVQRVLIPYPGPSVEIPGSRPRAPRPGWVHRPITSPWPVSARSPGSHRPITSPRAGLGTATQAAHTEIGVDPPSYHQPMAGLGTVPWVYRPITSPWAGLGTVTPLSACRRALQVGGAIPISYREWPRQAGYSNLPPEIQRNLFEDPWSPNLR